jgi:hypothetical protein
MSRLPDRQGAGGNACASRFWKGDVLLANAFGFLSSLLRLLFIFQGGHCE